MVTVEMYGDVTTGCDVAMCIV